MVFVLFVFPAITGAIKFGVPVVKSLINHLGSRDGEGNIDFTCTEPLLFTKADVEDLKKKGAWRDIERAETLYAVTQAFEQAAKTLQNR